MRCISLALLLLVTGCTPTPESLEIKPDNLLIDQKGGTLQLQVRPLDRNGDEIVIKEISFKSMTPTMATVSPTGLVRGVQSGIATILVTAGGYSKEVEISLQIPAKIEIDPSDHWLMLGVTRGYKATVINDRGKPILAGGVRWASSNPEVARVDKYGNVKTLTEGQTTITAFAAGLKQDTNLTVKHEEFDKESGTLSVMNEDPEKAKEEKKK